MGSYGTRIFTGYNVMKDATLLKDGDLVAAVNANLVSGHAVPQKDATEIVADRQEDRSDIISFRRDSTQHYVARLGDTNIYEDPTTATLAASLIYSGAVGDGYYGTIFSEADGRAYIFDTNGSDVVLRPKVWDGSYTRLVGALERATLTDLQVPTQVVLGVDVAQEAATQTLIDMTYADPGVFEVTGHGFVAGNRIVFDTLTGLRPGTLVGEAYTITEKIDDDHFTIETTAGVPVDTTDFHEFVYVYTPSAGTVRAGGIGLDGSFLYGSTVVVTMTDGQEIESQIYTIPYSGRYGKDTSETTIVIAAEDAVTVHLPTISASDIASYINSAKYATAKTITALSTASEAVVTSAAHGYTDGDIVQVKSITALTKTTKTITGIVAATGVVTSAAHGLSGGEIICISGLDEMTELNDADYEVVSIGATTFSLKYASGDSRGYAVDTTDYTDETTGGVFVPIDEAALLGNTGYYVVSDKATNTFKLKITDGNDIAGYVDTSLWSAWAAGGSVQLVAGEGAVTASLRLYRTKAAGTDYYLNSTTALTSAATGIAEYVSVIDTKRDADLGALYIHGDLDHGVPPDSGLGFFHNGRMFYASGSKLYFSLFGFPDYVNATSYHEFGDTITALGRYGSRVAVFCNSRWALLSQEDEVGYIDDIDSPVGCQYPNSVVTTPYGIVWATRTGLWSYNGSAPQLLTDAIEDDWRDVRGTSSGSDSGVEWAGEFWRGQLFFVASGTVVDDPVFVGRKTAEGIQWTRETLGGGVFLDPTAFTANGDNNLLYTATGSGNISTVGTGSESTTVALTTKKYGSGRPTRVARLVFDIDCGGSDETVTLHTSRGDSQEYTLDTATRQTVRKAAPMSFIAEYFWLTFSGTATIHGFSIETV